MRSATTPIEPQEFYLETLDDQKIGGYLWRDLRRESAHMRPVVIINSATSVVCRYYRRFAEYLAANGLDVVLYDYRGIGLSRPKSLRHFGASWFDWGCRDFEAVLRFVQASFTDQPIFVVAHSVGGVLLGLAESNHLIRRVVTVGAQYAYWRDYAAGTRMKMFLKWHVIMPIATNICGYFPGRRFGWLEDTPKGVVGDWTSLRARFEDRLRGRGRPRDIGKKHVVRQFSRLNAPMLAITVDDDEFGTDAAARRLLGYFRRCQIHRLTISPHELGEQTIGHFGFFNSRFSAGLWPIAMRWLISPQSLLSVQHPFEAK
jgi:predicted alpha/beta hydrolase